MAGHEDPEGIIKYDEEGRAYLAVVDLEESLNVKPGPSSDHGEPIDDLDLNGDGKFDKKDLTIAAKTLAKGRKKSTKKAKK